MKMKVKILLFALCVEQFFSTEGVFFDIAKQNSMIHILKQVQKEKNQKLIIDQSETFVTNLLSVICLSLTLIKITQIKLENLNVKLKNVGSRQKDMILYRGITEKFI